MSVDEKKTVNKCMQCSSMCVEDNETKKLILSVRLLPVTGRSFVQPEASSSLLANAEAVCVSSKLELLQVDLCLKKPLVIHLSRTKRGNLQTNSQGRIIGKDC